MADGAVSLRKSHDIVILSFCNIIKGQDNILMLRVGGSKFFYGERGGGYSK